MKGYWVNYQTKEHRFVSAGDYADPARWYLIQTDADGWIEWSGGECPLPAGSPCGVKLLSGTVFQYVSHQLRWEHLGRDSDIIAYRPILGENDMTTTAVDDQFAPDEGVWSGKGLPPVGLRVEYTAIKQDTKSAIVPGKWYSGKIIAYHDGYVWTSDNGIRRTTNTEFRPLPTARDRWVTSACKAIESETEQYNVNIDCSIAMRMTVEAIYDAILNGTLDAPWRD